MRIRFVHDKMKIARIVLISAVFLAMMGRLPAQETGLAPGRKLGVHDLAEPGGGEEARLISASRSAKYAIDLPVTTHVVTRKEIRENGYTSLGDVLKSVPGVLVSQPGSAMEGETFLMRGLFGNYYCKILIDDIPIQPSAVSGMPLAEQLPVRQAERIEIIFGPASSVYGADAIAGVINIITRRSERPVTASADVAIGSSRFEYLNVSIGGKAGKSKNVLTYQLFGNYALQADQPVKYDILDNYSPALYDTSYSYLKSPHYQGDSTVPVLGRIPRMSRMIGISAGWRGLSLYYIGMQRDMQSSVGLATDRYSYADVGNIWGEKIQRINLGWVAGGDKVSSQASFTYLTYRLDEQTSFGLIDSLFVSGDAYKYAASDDIILEERITWVPAASLELIAGGDFQYSGNLPLTSDMVKPMETSLYHAFSEEDISDTSLLGDFGFNPLRFHRYGGFLQAFWKPGTFSLLAGLRYDYHSLAGHALSPRIAVLVKLMPDFALRASFSTGYRVPSTYYYHASSAYQDGEGVKYTLVPNKDLEPESMMAAEIGARWKLSERFEADVAVFYHDLVNQFVQSLVLLDPEEYPLATNPARLALAYVNDGASRARLWGMQGSARLKDLVRPVHLGMDVLFTLSKGREVLPNDLGEIDDYRMMPVLMGQLNFNLRPANFLLINLRNNFATGMVRRFLPVSPELLESLGYPLRHDGYYTMDLMVRAYISKNFQAFFQLNNLLDEEYGGIDAYGNQYDLKYNPQYGRNFRLGLTFSLE